MSKNSTANGSLKVPMFSSLVKLKVVLDAIDQQITSELKAPEPIDVDEPALKLRQASAKTQRAEKLSKRLDRHEYFSVTGESNDWDGNNFLDDTFGKTWKKDDGYGYLWNSFTELFRKFCNGVAAESIKSELSRVGDAKETLDRVVAATLQLMKIKPRPTVRIWLTPLLNIRFLPEALRQAMSTSDDSSEFEIATETIEPAALGKVALDSDSEGQWDLVLCYGRKETVEAWTKRSDAKNIRQTSLHPCLMVLPEHVSSSRAGDHNGFGPLPAAEIRSKLGTRSLAVLSQFETVYPKQQAEAVLATFKNTSKEKYPPLREGALLRRSTTLELHKFVQCGLGGCITTIESQGESDAKGTDSYEIEELKDAISLFVVRRSAQSGSPKETFVTKLFETLKEMIDGYNGRYEMAKKMTRAFSRLAHCYMFAATRLSDGNNPIGFHWWRAKVSLQVQATLSKGHETFWVSGYLTVAGANDAERKREGLNETVAHALPLRVFGRICEASAGSATTAFVGSEQAARKWQMSLRGMSTGRTGHDLISVFAMFSSLEQNGELQLQPATTESNNAVQDQIVGHWLGILDANTEPLGPDAGMFVWDRSPHDSIEKLNAVSQGFANQFPLSLSFGLEFLGNNNPKTPSSTQTNARIKKGTKPKKSPKKTNAMRQTGSPDEERGKFILGDVW